MPPLTAGCRVKPSQARLVAYGSEPRAALYGKKRGEFVGWSTRRPFWRFEGEKRAVVLWDGSHTLAYIPEAFIEADNDPR